MLLLLSYSMTLRVLIPCTKGGKKYQSRLLLASGLFLVLGQTFCEIMLEGREDSAEKHLPFEGGNLWLEKQLNRDNNSQLTYSSTLLKKLKSSETVLLMALQWNSYDKSN